MYIVVETNPHVVKLLQKYYRVVKYTQNRIRVVVPDNERYEPVVELINLLDPSSIVFFA